MAKTGFSNGFANIPGQKYYKYHGWVRECNIEPILPPYLEFPVGPPCGPPVTVYFSAAEWKNREQNGLDYNIVHDRTYGAEYTRYSGQLRWDLGGGWSDYWIGRMFGIWDTSSIPDNAIIISSKIITSSTLIKKDSPFSVTIRSGMPVYPHFPIIDTDYYYLNYLGDYGSTYVVNIGAFEIDINALGLLIINKLGYTKFSLISDRDILRLTPYGPESFEYITFGYICRLKVIYKVPL